MPVNLRKVVQLFVNRDLAETVPQQQAICDLLNVELKSDAFPTIVCLCGSTRFYQEFQEANFKLTLEGKIVLTVGFYPHASMEAHHQEDLGITEQQKEELDELHKRKIDLADEVFIINKGKYLGASTLSELRYAREMGKVVRFLEPYGT